MILMLHDWIAFMRLKLKLLLILFRKLMLGSIILSHGKRFLNLLSYDVLFFDDLTLYLKIWMILYSLRILDWERFWMASSWYSNSFVSLDSSMLRISSWNAFLHLYLFLTLWYIEWLFCELSIIGLLLAGSVFMMCRLNSVPFKISFLTDS